MGSPLINHPFGDTPMTMETPIYAHHDNHPRVIHVSNGSKASPSQATAYETRKPNPRLWRVRFQRFFPDLTDYVGVFGKDLRQKDIEKNNWGDHQTWCLNMHHDDFTMKMKIYATGLGDFIRYILDRHLAKPREGVV